MLVRRGEPGATSPRRAAVCSTRRSRPFSTSSSSARASSSSTREEDLRRWSRVRWQQRRQPTPRRTRRPHACLSPAGAATAPVRGGECASGAVSRSSSNQEPRRRLQWPRQLPIESQLELAVAPAAPGANQAHMCQALARIAQTSRFLSPSSPRSFSIRVRSSLWAVVCCGRRKRLFQCHWTRTHHC